MDEDSSDLGLSAEDGLDPVANHFREWLNCNLSGCGFAAALAAKPGRLAFYTALKPVADQNPHVITTTVDRGATSGCPAVLVFPRVRTELEIAELISLLTTDARWRASVKEHPGGHPNAICVKLRFTTEAGHFAWAMGFGPCGHMPVTRRAPYVAIAVWAGVRLNPYFEKGPAGMVNLAHAPHGLSEDSHRNVWAVTREKVAQLVSDPPDDAAWFRDVAFALSSDVVRAQPFSRDLD